MHSLDTYQQNNLSGVNPTTFTKTCGADSTGLILHLVILSTTARTGGAPTYNGITLEQIDTVRPATETNVELWFLQSPPTGSAYTISIPNTNTRTIRAFTTSIKAQTGYTSIPDVSFGNTGIAANLFLTLPNTADDWAAIVAAFKEVRIVTDLQAYNVGQSTSPEISLPASASFLDYKIQRRNWTDTGSDVISVMVEISSDGGLTWPIVRGFTARGGTHLNRNGKMIPRSGISFDLPDVDNPNRKVRVTKNIFNNLTTISIVEII